MTKNLSMFESFPRHGCLRGSRDGSPASIFGCTACLLIVAPTIRFRVCYSEMNPLSRAVRLNNRSVMSGFLFTIWEFYTRIP